MHGPTRGKWIGVITIALASLAAWTTPEAARSRAAFVVSIPHPFSLQGTTFPSGRVSVRDVREYTPTVSMQEVSVDGKSLGVLMARRDRADVAQRSDAALLRRAPDGSLQLLGYVRAGGSIFRFLPDGPGVDEPTPDDLTLVSR